MNKTVVKKRINHDSMWIKSTFPTGESFKYRITRYNKVLYSEEIIFSNKYPDGYVTIFKSWLEKNKNMSYGDLFNTLENMSLECESGKDFITLIEK